MSAENETEIVQDIALQLETTCERSRSMAPAPDPKAEWDALEDRKTTLEAKLETANEPPPLLHPGMAELCARKSLTSRVRSSTPKRARKPRKSCAA